MLWVNLPVARVLARRGDLALTSCYLEQNIKPLSKKGLWIVFG